MNKIILGIDISSTTIGWGALEINHLTNEIKLINSGYIKPPKDGHIIDRLVETRDAISKIISEVNPDIIAIEDILKFMPKSTATTVVMLATFNRMICMLAYDFLLKKPELFNVMTIRHGLKTTKKLPEKKEIPELVAKHLGITFPFIKDKHGKIKIKKNKDVVEENRDMADGIAVALYCAFKHTNKLKSKK